MKTAIKLEEKKGIFKGKLQVQISDDPKSGLIRVIDFIGADISHLFTSIEFKAKMHYFNKAGEYLPNFTEDVRQRERKWKVDNSYNVIVRDNQGNPILNEEGEPQKKPAYNLFSELLFKMLEPLITGHIAIDDANKKFDNEESA